MSQRARNRKNRWGRRGGGNRCGHDPRHPVRARPWKQNIPKPARLLARAMQERPLPLMLGRYARRSELVEAVQAIGPVMASRTDCASGRIGKPDKKDPRRFVGLAVDHDLAPLSGISESRTERVIGTFTDWGWLHFHAVPRGRRKAKRGFLRCASQQVDKKPNGERRGHAAVRVWTAEVWRYYKLLPTLAEWLQRRSLSVRKAVANMAQVPVGPVVAELAATLGDPTSTPRPPP